MHNEIKLIFIKIIETDLGSRIDKFVDPHFDK